MARPVKAEADRRELVIAFRLNAEQFAQLSAYSKDAGFARVSDCARDVLLNTAERRPASLRPRPAPTLAPVAFEVADQLRRIGVNLNQLTKLAHFGDLNLQRIDDTLAEIHAVLEPMHSAAINREKRGRT